VASSFACPPPALQAAAGCYSRANMVQGTRSCIIVWRKILARELRAIAEGRPPKKWQTPPAEIVPTLGF